MHITASLSVFIKIGEEIHYQNHLDLSQFTLSPNPTLFVQVCSLQYWGHMNVGRNSVLSEF